MTRSAQVQAFADALRALKERSGLSYGTLASRLHVSTSTLHRYCAGDAVPAEYATVDRFARTCKASGQEMVELHRRWVLADAERARVPDPELGPSGSLPGGPLPEPTWGGDPPCQEPGKGSKRAPRCGGTEADSAESASDQSGADPPADPADRRPVLVRAGLVAVIVGALVAAAGGIWLATGAPGDDGRSTEAAPLSWTVRPELWAAGCEHTYLIDRPLAGVPAPPVEQDAAAWSGPLGAVDANRSIVELTVAGADADPVLLRGLFVRVADRRAPLSWDAYGMSQGCGGGPFPVSFEVNLDAQRPLARPEGGSDGERAIPPATFPLRVSSSEPAVLRVEARTTRCDCDWYLELEWSQGARSGLVRFDDSGVPFRTSAARGDAHGYTDRWSG